MTKIDHQGIGKVLHAYKLQVPTYQRSYSWTPSQIDDLVDDILRAIGNRETDYFLGSIVLTFDEKSDRPSVIDGQQRLASTTMLYAAIRDYLIGDNRPEVATNIANTYLYTKDRWTNDIQPRLELNTDDSMFFARYVLEAPDSPNRMRGEPDAKVAASNRRIAAAFKRVNERIASIVRNKNSEDAFKVLRELDDFILNNAKVIILSVPSDLNAYNIFETLNDRGLDLTIADLLKNFVFGRVERDKLAFAQAHWAASAARVTSEGDSESAVIKFIHHFWSSKNGLVRERLLYKSIKDEINSSLKAVNFLVELSESSKNYAAILNSDNPIWSNIGTEGRGYISVLHMLKMEQYKPLLLACMDTFDPAKPKELLLVLRALVSWSVRFRITGLLGSSRLEQFYGNAGKFVRDNSLKTAGSVIDKFSSEIPNDLAFYESFKLFSETNGKLARYYLRELEIILHRDAGETELQVVPDEMWVNLEHVLPKEAKLEEWPGFDQETHPVYVNRLGNQLLLSKAENERLGNKSYPRKREAYRVSSLKLVKGAIEFPEWTPATVNTLQENMAKLAVRVWPIG